MSPQLIYALKRVAAMMVLAILGVLSTEFLGILQAAGIDQAIYGGIIAAVLASAVRAVEGYRDGLRAERGETIPEDVKPLPVYEVVLQ